MLTRCGRVNSRLLFGGRLEQGRSHPSATDAFAAQWTPGQARGDAGQSLAKRASIASQIRAGVSVPLNVSIATIPVGEVTLISVR